MNPVVHFEMPAVDKKRMVDFYSRTFGWQMEEMGLDMGEYVSVTTTPVDPVSRRPQTPGAINGGFYPKSVDSNQHPSIVISVDDINVAAAKVNAAGGNVIGQPVEIPGVGLYVSFIDTEGNRVSLLQPAPMK